MTVLDADVPPRLLAGGGPSSPDPRVRRAMSLPVIGQFDPAFTAVMDDVMALAETRLSLTPALLAVSASALGGPEHC
jgi:aspartate aminotransferase-like enzyme